MIFPYNSGILIMPNQLNILSKGYFYLYGIVIPFLRRVNNEFAKMQTPTDVAMIEYRFLPVQLVWRLSEFAFLVRLTSVAAFFIIHF